MRIINGVKYYNSREVAELVNRSRQTVCNWDRYSDILEEKGEERLIPQPIRMVNNWRFWSEDDVKKIKHFAKNIQNGDMAEYNRPRWGKR